jgi:hypothetical protein
MKIKTIKDKDQLFPIPNCTKLYVADTIFYNVIPNSDPDFPNTYKGNDEWGRDTLLFPEDFIILEN